MVNWTLQGAVEPPDRQSFNYHGARLWNNLRDGLKSSDSVKVLTVQLRYTRNSRQPSTLIVYSIRAYYIERSILMENTPLGKFIRNYIRDSNGMAYFPYLHYRGYRWLHWYHWYHWYQVCLLIFFSNVRQSSEISENVREGSSGLRNYFGKSFVKWSEIFRKPSKTPSSVCLYNEKNFTR